MEPIEIIKGEDYTAILVLARTKEAYKIITGNYLSNENAKSLKESLDELSCLDENSLNLKYQKVLTEEGFSKKGAGLGLIEMFKKSRSEVFYNFKKINDNYSFYSVQVNIKKK